MERIPLDAGILSSAEEQYFEEEFKKRQIVEIHGGEVEVLDISPPELKHENPTLFISGYGDGSPEGRKANIAELVKEGRRTIIIKSPHGVESQTTDERAEEFSDTLLRQVAAIAPVLEQKGTDKVSIIGESRGGLVALMAAYLHPEKFSDVVLVDPVGLVDSMNSAKLSLRFIMAGMAEGKIFNERIKAGEVSEMNKEQVVWGTKNFMKWILGDPKASVKEIRDMAQTEVAHLLTKIKSEGIGISVIHGVDDKVFPMKDVQANISGQIEIAKAQLSSDGTDEDATQKAFEKVVDGFYSVKGGHGGFNTNAELYTRAASQALSALEAKRRQKQEKS